MTNPAVTTGAPAARPRRVALPGLPALLLLLALSLLLPAPAPPASATGPPSPALVATPAAAPPPLGRAPATLAAPRLTATAALLVDAATGQVLHARAPDRPVPMASTTKVMTALVVLESGVPPGRVVRVSAAVTRLGPDATLRLQPGERLTVGQLLTALMVQSANDAAVTLAEAVAGSEHAFVQRMNRRAAELGLDATHYANPHGLDHPRHRTSARDLARLWAVAMRRADFRKLVATRTAALPAPPGSRTPRRLRNTNALLGTYRWMVGGKTGYTDEAGRCLVATAARGGRRLVAVALGARDAFADVHALFEHGFTGFVRARLARAGQVVAFARAAGLPARWRLAVDVDALVPAGLLGEVRVRAREAGADQPPEAWLEAGGAVLARLPLAPAPAAGAAAGGRLGPPVVVPRGGRPAVLDPFLAGQVA